MERSKQVEDLLDDIVPIRQMVQRYPHHGSEASWRWRRFTGSQNGLDDAGVFVTRGNRVLVNIRAYVSYLTGGQDV